MDSIPQKRCTKCGELKPATTEYFSKQKDALRSMCKECGKKYSQKWRSENTEQHRQYSKDWKKDNPEHARFLSREYQKRKRQRDPERVKIINKRSRDKHKDKRNAETKARRLKYPDKYKLSKAKTRENRRDKERQYAREWAKKNPIKRRLSENKRRARKRNLGGEVTLNDIQVQLRSQKGKCWWCGVKLSDKYHLDHRTPLDKGGLHTPSNIVISCEHCNLSKGKKYPWEWNGRLL